MLVNARSAAYEILFEFERSGARIDDLVHSHLAQFSLKQREIKNVYSLVFGVLRHRNTLDWKTGKYYAGNYTKMLNKLKTILRLAFFEIDYQDFIPAHATVNEYVTLAKVAIDKKSSAIVNGVLRSYLRQKNKYNPAKSFKSAPSRLSVQYSFPEWMITSWINEWGENDAEKICRAFNERPRFTLRINPNLIDKESFIKKLKEKDIEFAQSQYFSNALKITDIQSVQRSNFFRKGLCTVQDESSLLVVDLLSPHPGEYILDACAAPGGKYTAILQKTAGQAKLTGLEPFRERVQLIRENCRAQQLGPCHIVQGKANDAPFSKKFDKILVDAPCSGTGTIRKHPDIKWRRTEKEIEEFFSLQLQILEGVCRLVEKNGYILYSTCSIQPRENEDVVTTFIKNHGQDFILLRPPAEFSDFVYKNYFIKTFPHIHDMDGTFAALIGRSDNKNAKSG